MIGLRAEAVANPHSSWNNPKKLSRLDSLKMTGGIAAILALGAASHLHNKGKDIIDKIFGRKKEDNHKSNDHTS